MSNVQNIDNLSREDLVRIVRRDQAVKAEQSARLGGLMTENLELLVVINEQGAEIGQLREMLSVVSPAADEQEAPPA